MRRVIATDTGYFGGAIRKRGTIFLVPDEVKSEVGGWFQDEGVPIPERKEKKYVTSVGLAVVDGGEVVPVNDLVQRVTAAAPIANKPEDKTPASKKNVL